MPCSAPAARTGPRNVPLLTGVLAGALPAGDYRFASPLPDPELAALGFLAGSYRFSRYKSADGAKPKRLVLPHGASKDQVLALAEALYFGRDLINTPANDLGPAELEGAARELATAFGAGIKVTEGSGLLSDNFPMIHAVGRASDRAPRLIDLRWGSEHAPKVTIVGKGICFDTGGLDIKPGSGMALMKKDMGGAASALAFAHLVMRAKLPVRLRVLIPAAENAIAGNAFRPGDVLPSRNGMTVEIGNTDAEGRLVLADAISLADEEAPDYLITIATLTGAARVALGPDLPPLYSNDEDLAAGLARRGSHRGRSVMAHAVMGALRRPAQERRSPMSTTSPRAVLPARSSPLYFSSASSATPSVSLISTFSAGCRASSRDVRKAASRKRRARCSISSAESLATS